MDRNILLFFVKLHLCINSEIVNSKSQPSGDHANHASHSNHKFKITKVKKIKQITLYIFYFEKNNGFHVKR